MQSPSSASWCLPPHLIASAHSTRSTPTMPRVLHFSAHSVDYFSDESSSSTASGNAGGGESDSDSSYCPTSDSCESETVVKSGVAIYRATYRY